MVSRNGYERLSDDELVSEFKDLAIKAGKTVGVVIQDGGFSAVIRIDAAEIERVLRERLETLRHACQSMGR